MNVAAAATAATGAGAAVGTAAADQALARLRASAERGHLAADYPSVAPLLAGLDRADLARAGRLLVRLDPDEVLRHHPGTRTVTAVLTGSSTLGGLTAPLTAELARTGLLLRPHLSDYDQWTADLAGPPPVEAPDLLLCLLDAEAVLRTLPSPWRVEDAERAAAETLAQLTALAERHDRDGSGTLVLNTVPLLPGHTRQLLDHASRTGLGILWREFNIGLLRLAARLDRVSVVDLDPLLAEGGPVHDVRLAAYAKAQFGDELLARYAREAAQLARARFGQTRKVLVLDLDGTLWDGVLSDDGPDRIAAAGTLRGESFGRFQRVVRQLGSQGVLLAVSSKNDREPVLDVLREHPDLVLRADDFAAVEADWSPKAGHLLSIAGQLGLALDSLVHVDDSPVECALIRAAHPGVAVVELGDDPAEHVQRLLAEGWFDVPALTSEDRARPAQYQAEAARRDALPESPSADHLASLAMEVALSPVQPHEIDRVAQLTLRTNQFNLTGERLQAADVRARLADGDRRVLAVRSRDRFGDQGVVGVVFISRTRSGLRLDNVLLSCRVLSRGVEQAVLAAVLTEAAAVGLTSIDATFRPTPRNQRNRDFYPSLGFQPLSACPQTLDFRHDLTSLPDVPAHLFLTSAFTLWQTTGAGS